LVAAENIIAGNVILYGATRGELYLNGKVGERFCVRNSGATAVVEGVGDHACEYMTGGRVVVLGSTGRNFGAGMSGGIAYVYDHDGQFATRVNYEMVAFEELDSTDIEFLKSSIERHQSETGSPRAVEMLQDWDNVLSSFVKVMPKDYKRVLQAIKRAEAEGRNVDEAVMEASQ
jgi:glutamate synthase (NADPH/NADH) large chain